MLYQTQCWKLALPSFKLFSHRWNWSVEAGWSSSASNGMLKILKWYARTASRSHPCISVHHQQKAISNSVMVAFIQVWLFALHITLNIFQAFIHFWGHVIIKETCILALLDLLIIVCTLYTYRSKKPTLLINTLCITSFVPTLSSSHELFGSKHLSWA